MAAFSLRLAHREFLRFLAVGAVTAARRTPFLMRLAVSSSLVGVAFLACSGKVLVGQDDLGDGGGVDASGLRSCEHGAACGPDQQCCQDSLSCERVCVPTTHPCPAAPECTDPGPSLEWYATCKPIGCAPNSRPVAFPKCPAIGTSCHESERGEDCADGLPSSDPALCSTKVVCLGYDPTVNGCP